MSGELTIWRVTLDLIDSQIISVPNGAEFLTAQVQLGALSAWFRCDPGKASSNRVIWICGTGHHAPDPDESRYLATVQMAGGTLVWHIFEATK